MADLANTDVEGESTPHEPSNAHNANDDQVPKEEQEGDETTTSSMPSTYRPSLSCGVYGAYHTDYAALCELKQNEATLQSLTAEFFSSVTTRGNDIISQNRYYHEYAMQNYAGIRRQSRANECKQENHDADSSQIQSLSQELQAINHDVGRLLSTAHSSVIEQLTNYQRRQQEVLMGIYRAENEDEKQKRLLLFFKMSQEIKSQQEATREKLSEFRQKLTSMKRRSDQLRIEIISVIAKLQQSMDGIFEFAKKIYKEQESPVIIDQNKVLQDVQQNAANYKNVALPLTLGQDRAFETWDEEQFKREFSRKFDIPIECIQIASVKAGSTIIDLRLTTHATGTKMRIPIECIAENISTNKARKEMAEFGIFAMEFREPEEAFKHLQKRVIMNPRWNREYGTGQGQTCWKGALNDGKSRGGEPYFCPSGWKRYAVQFSEVAYDFDNVYDDWPIAYHGTTFDAHMLITLSGLKCSENKPGRACHGTGVYLSPSIKYVAHPRYCPPVRLNLSKTKQAEWSAENLKEWRKYHKKWIQCAFACRVKPGSYTKHRETMGLGQQGTFDGVDKREIEWLVPGKPGEIIGSEKILIYGYMIKVSDTRPPDEYDPADVNEGGCVVM